MHLKPFMLFLLLTCLSILPLIAQDDVERPMPAMISHLTHAHRDILRIKNAPKHNIFQKILCFQVNCRREAGWQKSQKDRRFNDYKDVPQVRHAKNVKKSESKALVHTTEPQALKPDTVDIKKLIEPIIQKEAAKERRFTLSEVLFDVNSPAIKKEVSSRLDTLVDILRKSPNTTVTIIGHTDNTGREAYNVRLSTSRAEAVGDYLIDHGIAYGRVHFEGRGSAEPIADNTFEEGRMKNRRVEIILKE